MAMSIGVFAHAAQVNQPETWATGTLRGWRLLNQAEGTYETGKLAVVEGALEWTLSPAATGSVFSVIASVDASEGWFAGDYFDVGVYAIRFDLYASHPVQVEVELWHATDMLSYMTHAEIETGWVTFEIPVDLARFSPWIGVADAQDFWRLLKNVGHLWIGVNCPGVPEERTFRVRAVELAGAGPGYAAWIQQFEGALEHKWPAVDWDGDGMSNAAEYIAGTSPNDATDWLRLDVVALPLALRWQSSLNRIYTLWRSSDLHDGFPEQILQIEGTGGEMEYVDPDAEEIGLGIYRLEVKRSDW